MMKQLFYRVKNFIVGLWKAVIRTLAFVRKEIFNILRQPLLLVALVLGPFLILLIFGIGYRNEPRSLRTLFVAHQDSKLGEQIEDYAPTLGRQLVYMGVVDDIVPALKKLEIGEVDLVAVAPSSALNSIKKGEQAEFKLYHREIDPQQVGYVDYFGRIYIDELNRRVLRAITAESQVEANEIRSSLESAQINASRLEQALGGSDEIEVKRSLTRLSNNIDTISLAVGGSLSVLNSIEETMGGERSQEADEILTLLKDVQQMTAEMQEDETPIENQSVWERQISEINTDLEHLTVLLETFSQLDPNVIVSPFASETMSFTELQPDAVSFFAPAVISLLIQHLAVAMAALSVVQESDFGTLEIFRVAPLSAEEMLVGKTISFLLITLVIGLTLAALMHFGLDIPMIGYWLDYLLVMVILILASLGIGFVISLVAQTDSQAVQFTMIVLLLSVFFSGLIMNLTMIWAPVRVVSWSIPTTYGIILLREIALRGSPLDLKLFLGLVGIGLGLFILAWALVRRKMARY